MIRVGTGEERTESDGRASPPRRRSTWLDVRESGSLAGARFVLWLVRVFGRRSGRAFLRLLVFYYVLARPSVRGYSRAYLRRIGAPARLRDVYRHVLRFAHCALDRALFLRGRAELFDITLTGHQHLVDMVQKGRGGLLLGAHLGSFEAMRLAAVERRIPITVVMNTTNARLMSKLAAQLDPEGTVRILDAGSEGLDFVFRIREIVERGELVAILGDRVGPSERHAMVPFLGSLAPFPVGPYLVAAALRCPVYLTFGLYRGGNRYELHCEPFAERLVLERPREAALADCAARFAGRLEHYCRLAPDNWFNFFDFWGSGDVSPPDDDAGATDA